MLQLRELKVLLTVCLVELNMAHHEKIVSVRPLLFDVEEGIQRLVSPSHTFMMQG